MSAHKTVELDGAIFWMDGDALLSTYKDDHAMTLEEIWENAGEVTAPEDQGFLDRVNAALGTDLRFEDFAGR